MKVYEHIRKYLDANENVSMYMSPYDTSYGGKCMYIKVNEAI